MKRVVVKNVVWSLRAKKPKYVDLSFVLPFVELHENCTHAEYFEKIRVGEKLILSERKEKKPGERELLNFEGKTLSYIRVHRAMDRDGNDMDLPTPYLENDTNKISQRAMDRLLDYLEYTVIDVEPLSKRRKGSKWARMVVAADLKPGITLPPDEFEVIEVPYTQLTDIVKCNYLVFGKHTEKGITVHDSYNLLEKYGLDK